MKDWRRWCLAVGGVAIISGGWLAYLAAQPEEEATTTVSPVSDTQLSVKAMTARAKEILKKIEVNRSAVRKSIHKTTADKDVIKLDCLGNADTRLASLLEVGTGAVQLLETLASDDREHAVFQYQKVVIAGELAEEATGEASTCAGGFELAFGDDKLEVEGPEVSDDPTKDKKRTDGFDPIKPEHAGQGSPF